MNKCFALVGVHRERLVKGHYYESVYSAGFIIEEFSAPIPHADLIPLMQTIEAERGWAPSQVIFHYVSFNDYKQDKEGSIQFGPEMMIHARITSGIFKQKLTYTMIPVYSVKQSQRQYKIWSCHQS